MKCLRAACCAVIVVVLQDVNCFAAPTSENDARKAVAGWLKLTDSPLKAKMNKDILGVQEHTDADGAAVYYVVSLKPEGYVVVAPDDLIEPIIAFSPVGAFDADPNNPFFALLQGDLPGRIAHVRGLEAEAAKAKKEFVPSGLLEKSKSKWSNLSAYAEAEEPIEMASSSSVDDVRVAVLVQSRWSQSAEGGNTCYNLYTPSNYVCGCVATALAQVMRHHQHPTTGVGTAAYSITVNGVADTQNLRGGDGAGGPYDWANMVLDPGLSITLAERQAIGALCVDAGSSVNMQYAADGSSASTLQTAAALKNVFGYANAVGGYSYPNELTDNGFNQMANPCLDAGLPVILGIRATSSGSGHAIVCDGYGYNTGTLYHHLNMGWAGSQDAWYTLPDVGAGFDFDQVHTCVYNIFVTGTGEIISGRAANPSGTPQSGLTVTAVDGGTQYTDVTDSRGIYAIRVPSATSFTLSCPGAASKMVSTGTSATYGASGNLWAQNFVVAAGPAVFYSTDTFTESTANDGSISNPIIISLYGDTFTGSNGGNLVGNVSISNLPAGLTAQFIKDSDTQLTVSLTGNAVNHHDSDDVANLTFTFQNAAFTGGNASALTDYSKADLVVDFSDILLAENFDAAPSRPSGWTESVVAGAVSWRFQSGGYTGGSYPGSANSAPYNATLCFEGYGDYRTRLISPAFDSSGCTGAVARFQHCMITWPEDTDNLLVYYRTNAAASWVAVAAYTSAVASWTEQEIPLPAVGDACQIAFEGDANYGYGVCIDDVVITGYGAVSGQVVTQSLTVASAHGTPSPDVGVWWFEDGTQVTASVNSPVTMGGGTQYLCTGWAMTGNAPFSGIGTNMTMTHTNDAVLTWLWSTNYWLDTASTAGGSVLPADSWHGAGSNVTVTATPNAGYRFTGWSGTIGGWQNPFVLMMNQPHSAAASFSLDRADPDWWQPLGVLNTNAAVTNDYAACNAGQLKAIATAARDAMSAVIGLNTPAGTNVNAMVSGLPSNSNYVAVNIGQAKAVAKPFYDRLIEAGKTNQYPWAGAPQTNDFGAANIGQVKNLFSFDLP